MNAFRHRAVFVSVIAFLAIAFLLSYLFIDSDLFGRRTPRPLPERTTDKVIPEDLRFGILKAESLFKAGKREKAVSVLRSLRSRYPQDADVRYFLAAYLLVDAKYTKAGTYKDVRLIKTDVEEGLSNLRRASELAPNKKEYLYTYAVGLADLGRNHEAIREFERIFTDDTVRHHPRYRRLILNYADALVAVDQRERALEEYRKSLAVAPEDEEINKAYQALLKQQNIKK